jgi:hypothetical protein
MFASQIQTLTRCAIAGVQIGLVILLLTSSNAVGQVANKTQADKPSSQPSMTTPRSDPPRSESLSWPNPNRPTEPLPSSSVVEIKSSLTELTENVELMQEINNDLQRAIYSTSPLDYLAVATNASDIKRLAIRMMRNLELPADAPQPSPETTMPIASVDELKAKSAILDQDIQAFLKDPVLGQRRIVAVGQLNSAGAKLEEIVNGSTLVQKAAESLAGLAGKAGRKEAGRVKSRLISSPFMKLTLECGAWSMSELLTRPARIRDSDSIKLIVNIQTFRHTLNEPLLLPIDNCVDGETYEKAIINNEKHVAIVNDYTSYEVKGRVFAYRVDYQVGFMKNGQLTKLSHRPIIFYFVDEAGDGNFDLLKEPAASGLVPDWAVELARKPKL